MTVRLADRCDRPTLLEYQRSRLVALLEEILPRNPFYRQKFSAAGLIGTEMRAPADLPRIPFTTKGEILADQTARPPYGRNLTYPLECYCRMHQTSGTTGR